MIIVIDSLSDMDESCAWVELMAHLHTLFGEMRMFAAAVN